MIDTNPYSSGFLDRAAELRDSADSLAARLAHADTAFLPVWRMKNYIYAANGQAETGQATGPSMAIVPAVRWREHVTCPTDEHIFLGLRDGTAYFTADISHIEAPDRHPALTGPGTFEDLRQIGPLLEPADASLLAYARGIVYWHTRHRFCGECGSPTKVKSSGHRRQCTNEMCVAEQFPRTDPAVIMLVHDTDRIIMGRSPRFPPGMHSVLAGFLEPGESLEDAVAREVREEVGVAVTDIHYHSSQPWPFPSSLMVGFRARAVTFDLTPNPAELENASWYSKDELLSVQAQEEEDARAPFRLPRKDSIARRLIEGWLAEHS